MPDWPLLFAIGCTGLTAYALRAAGFLAAGLMPQTGPLQRFLRLAPGNLFVAFVAAGFLKGGAPSIMGSLVALVAGVITRRDWAALTAGFVSAAATSAIIG